MLRTDTQSSDVAERSESEQVDNSQWEGLSAVEEDEVHSYGPLGEVKFNPSYFKRSSLLITTPTTVYFTFLSVCKVVHVYGFV